MIAYVDASVLLRVALGQPDALREWRQINQGVSSALIMTESLRTLDRLRLRANLTEILGEPNLTALEPAWLAKMLNGVIVTLSIGRLGCYGCHDVPGFETIHLATALLWKQVTRTNLVVATHDGALALAAHAHGLAVVGAAQ